MSKEHYVLRYRVRNWPEYNRALVARGSLTFWFDEESIAVWRQTEPTGGSGRPRLYSDTAIQCALVLRCVFRLSLRAGFDNQRVEAIVKCAVLNRMTSLGMPDSVRI